MKHFIKVNEVKNFHKLHELSSDEIRLTSGGMALLYAIRPPYQIIIDLITKTLK